MVVNEIIEKSPLDKPNSKFLSVMIIEKIDGIDRKSEFNDESRQNYSNAVKNVSIRYK